MMALVTATGLLNAKFGIAWITNLTIVIAVILSSMSLERLADPASRSRKANIAVSVLFFLILGVSQISFALITIALKIKA